MNRSLDAVVLRYLGYACVVFAGLFLLYLVRGTLPIFFVALLLAYAMEPILQRLERRGYSRRSAVGFVFLVFLLLFVLLLCLLASAWQQALALSANFEQYKNQALALADTARHRLDASPLPPDMKKSVIDIVTDAQDRAPLVLSQKLQSFIAWTLGSVGYLGILLVVLPVITLYLMLEMNPLRARILMLVPPAYRRDVTEIGQKINEILGRYVRGQIIVCSGFGVLCTIAFHVLGYEYGMGYPLVLGLAAAILYIVPYVGLAIVTVAAGATAYLTASAPLPCAILAVGCCIVFNLIIDYGIAPRVIGKGVGLHPLMVIFALLSGFGMGGIPGMVLAVPFFASLRVILIYLFPQLAAPIPQTPPESEMTRDEKNASPARVAREVVSEMEKAETAALEATALESASLEITPREAQAPL